MEWGESSGPFVLNSAQEEEDLALAQALSASEEEYRQQRQVSKMLFPPILGGLPFFSEEAYRNGF